MPTPSEKESSVPSAPETKKAESPEAAQGKEPVDVVSRKEFVELLKRIDGQSALLNRLEKVAQKPPQEAAPQQDPLAERVKVLEEAKAKVDARNAAQKNREALQKIESALVAGGIDPKSAPRAAKLLQLEHGKNIDVDDDSFAVRYRESENVATPIDQWVGAWLKTDDAAVFFPTRRNPQVANALRGEGDAKGTRTVSQADLASGKVSTEDILKGKVKILDQ